MYKSNSIMGSRAMQYFYSHTDITLYENYEAETLVF